MTDATRSRVEQPSGKSRSLRILLDYYKHRGWLYWSRWILSIVALILTGGYAGLVVFGIAMRPTSTSLPPQTSPNWLQRWAKHVNTGPLSRAHMGLEDQCHQCHSNDWLKQAIASDAVFSDPAMRLSHLTDACKRCHATESHVALGNEKASRIDQDCVACHSEHNGRNFPIALVENPSCSQCHAGLQEFAAGSQLNPKIDAFNVETHAVGNGKNFRSLQTDGGRIKFDHAQHMNPGQVESMNSSKGAFRADMLAAKWRNQYSANEQGLVQLACADCHRIRTPNGDVAVDALANTSSATDREMSHHFAPIQYEQHCVACHQMTFVGQTDEMLPLPHAAPRAETSRILAAKIQGGRITGDIRVPKNVNPQEKPLTSNDLAPLVDRVYSQCEKCHLAADVADAEIVKRLSREPLAPMVPQRRLLHGSFDHGAHNKVDCTFCHDWKTLPQADGKPIDHQTVMIKGPESCVPCHRDQNLPAPSGFDPKTIGASDQPMLASDNCQLCHRYHWSRKPSQSLSSKTGTEAGK